MEASAVSACSCVVTGGVVVVLIVIVLRDTVNH
jgi:hypothetical protein